MYDTKGRRAFRIGSGLETEGLEFNFYYFFFVNDLSENIDTNLDGVIILGPRISVVLIV